MIKYTCYVLIIFVHCLVLQKSMGELHMEIGAYASAMEVFDRLGLWAPLIVCAQRAGRLGKVSGFNPSLRVLVLCIQSYMYI